MTIIRYSQYSLIDSMFFLMRLADLQSLSDHTNIGVCFGSFRYLVLYILHARVAAIDELRRFQPPTKFVNTKLYVHKHDNVS